MNPRAGRGAITTNPATWGTFDEAVRFYVEWQGREHTHQSKGATKTGPIAGVGFVLTLDDPYVGIDLDHCVAEEGTIEPWAQEIIRTMGSYTEVSPSGSGVRIFAKGKLPDKSCRSGDVEMYETGRFLTLTGTPLPGAAGTSLPIVENQAGIGVVHKNFIAKPAAPSTPTLSSTGPTKSQTPVMDDDSLLAKIRASKQADKFNTLMSGDHSAYRSPSEADRALCGILAFWTQNADQMDRLFRSSALYRPKWNEQRGAQTYGTKLIAKAIAEVKDVYRGSPQGSQAEEAEGVQGSFLPPPPPVPLDAFPASVVVLLKEASAAFGVPLEIPTVSLLALLSCLVGRSRVIRIKQSWSEAGNLWLALVAKSGMGKTPCMKAFFSPIHRREAASKKNYDQQFVQYNFAEQVHKRQIAANAEAQAKGKAASSPIPQPPQKPYWKQVLANDATPEALGEMLQANPKGVLWMTDELASLVLGLDKYSKKEGATKSFLLSSYDSQSVKTNRVNEHSRNAFVPNACVGIFGGVQPGVLPTLFSGGVGGLDEESGFLPRLIFIRAVASGPSYFSEQTLSGPSQTFLDNIASTLWTWNVVIDASGNEIEKTVLVSDAAKAIYVGWYNSVEDDVHSSSHSARLKKLQGQALRLCLLLHCLDAALLGADGLTPVTEDTMRRALLLADWIREHQNQCWPLLVPGGKVKQATSLETAIMQVVVENADTIMAGGGKIKSAELMTLVKMKPGMSRILDKQVEKVASSLQLKAGCKLDGSRAREVTAEQIEMFRTTVLTVPAVQAQALVTVPIQSSSGGEPSVTVPGIPHNDTRDGFMASCLRSGLITASPLGDVIAALPEGVLKNFEAMRCSMWSGFYPKDSSGDSFMPVADAGTALSLNTLDGLDSSDGSSQAAL